MIQTAPKSNYKNHGYSLPDHLWPETQWPDLHKLWPIDLSLLLVIHFYLNKGWCILKSARLIVEGFWFFVQIILDTTMDPIHMILKTKYSMHLESRLLRHCYYWILDNLEQWTEGPLSSDLLFSPRFSVLWKIWCDANMPCRFYNLIR